MKRTATDRNDAPRPKPVEKITLDEKPSRIHVLVFLGFVVLAAVSLFFGIRGCVTKEPGWDTVTPSTFVGSSASEFVFQYKFGQGDASATDESRALTTLYTSLSQTAYRLFHESETFDGTHNLAYLSAHPNQDVTVDAALYRALALVTADGNRYIYYAPIFALYRELFSCEDGDDVFASEFDPEENATIREILTNALTFVRDTAAVDLKLLGDNRVRLSVSDAYLAFLSENEGLPTLDLFRMKNAVTIDYLADALTERGYTRGVLTCADGFIRNLNPNGEDTLTFGIQDGDADGIRVAATYNGAAFRSVVQLRAFSRGEGDPYTYTYRDGAVRSAFVSLGDGRPCTAARLLHASSKTLGCTEQFLRLYGLYTAPTLTDTDLLALASEDIHTVCAFAQDRVLFVSDETLVLRDIYSEGNIAYTTSFLPF